MLAYRVINITSVLKGLASDLRYFAIGIIITICFIISPSYSFGVENETTFISMLPYGGAEWQSIGETHVAIHSNQNRLYTVASTTTENQLIHWDTVTCGIIAFTKTAAERGWQCRDIEVWGDGNEVLVGWGQTVESTVRTRGLAFERLDVHTGSSKSVDKSVQYIAFDIDQNLGETWGIGESQTGDNYNLIRVELEDGTVSEFDTSIPILEAIVRDVIVDATHRVLYALYQPTREDDPNRREDGGYFIAYDLPTAATLGQVIIPDDKFRMGGIALDEEREFLYAIPEEPQDNAIYRIDVSRLILDATFTTSQISSGYQTGSAIAVHKPTGYVFISNHNEQQIDRRVLLVDLLSDTPIVIGKWSSGVDPNQLVYDHRINLTYAVSQNSQSITLIFPDESSRSIQSLMVIQPWDMIYDASHKKILLLSKSGEIYSFDPFNNRLRDRVDTSGFEPDVVFNLDTLRSHFFVGNYGQRPPSVYDSETIIKIGGLTMWGGTLAISEKDGLLFQTYFMHLQSSPIYISSATDGSLLKTIPDSARFGTTFELALDDNRNLLYGITRTRNSYNLNCWYFNWVTEASGDLVIPNTSWGSFYLFDYIAVEPNSGKIAIVGESGPDIYLLLYDSPFDTDPLLFSLDEVSLIMDIEMDSKNQMVVLLGIDKNTFKSRLYWLSLQDTSSLQQELLDFDSILEYMALDSINGKLWFASSIPSGLYVIPWSPGIKKINKLENNITLNVEALSGYNHLKWALDFPLIDNVEFKFFRKDGIWQLFDHFFLHRCLEGQLNLLIPTLLLVYPIIINLNTLTMWAQ